MSFLQYPEAMNVPKLQVWDNAAFDSEEPTKASFSSWSSLHPVIETQSESHDSDQSKENLSPVIMNSPVSVKSSIPVIIKPLHSNGVLGNSQRKPTKVSAGKNGGSVENPPATALTMSKKKKNGSEQEDAKKIDAEIEEIENEIKRLSSRLEALRLEKIARATATASEKRGRVVPAKFLEAKQSVKIEEPPPLLSSSSVKAKPNRRAVSMGPSEIFAGARFRPPGKLEITPVQPIQSRRKSCFWKLQEIDETKSIIERRKSMTVSPKSRKTASKIEGQKQIIAATTTTLGNRKNMKKESPSSSKSSSLSSSGVLSLIQPRKLFKDGNEKEKSVPTTNKKPLKPGRVVASRYNQNLSSLEAARKRSLPEKEKEKEDGGKKSRGNQGTEGRIKKRWEIPSEEEKEKKPLMMMMTDLLPRIKTTRCVDESPRGSGPAKKVSELERRKKKSYFCTEEEDENEDDEEHHGVPRIKTTRCVDESPRGSGPAKKVSELEKRKKKSFFCTEEEDENEDGEEHHGVALEFAQEEGDYDDDDDDDDERLMK